MKYKSNNKKVNIRVLTPTDSIRELIIKDPYETARIARLLEGAGIKTIGQLCLRERHQLMSIPKLGEISIERLSHELSIYGYHFGMSKERLMDIQKGEGLMNHDDVLAIYQDNIREILIKSAIEQPMDADENEEDDDSSSALDCIDWEERFYNLAKEEYVRLGSKLMGDLRIDYALAAAEDFILRIQKHYEKKMMEE